MTKEDKVLIEALRILAREIESDDGVANTCIYEASNKIEILLKEIEILHTVIDSIKGLPN